MWGPQDKTGARGSILICLEQTEETAVLPQSDNLHGKQIPAELKDFFKQINNELAKVVDKEIWMSSDIIFVMRTDLPPPRRGRQPAENGGIWYLSADYPQQLKEAAAAEQGSQW